MGRCLSEGSRGGRRLRHPACRRLACASLALHKYHALLDGRALEPSEPGDSVSVVPYYAQFQPEGRRRVGDEEAGMAGDKVVIGRNVKIVEMTLHVRDDLVVDRGAQGVPRVGRDIPVENVRVAAGWRIGTEA